MTCFKTIYSKNAEKFMKKNPKVGVRFLKAFSEISDDKENLKFYDVKKYMHKEYNDIFRLRIGSYRAIFRIIEQEIIIYVFDIGSRGDIYKNNI